MIATKHKKSIVLFCISQNHLKNTDRGKSIHNDMLKYIKQVLHAQNLCVNSELYEREHRDLNKLRISNKLRILITTFFHYISKCYQGNRTWYGTRFNRCILWLNWKNQLKFGNSQSILGGGGRMKEFSQQDKNVSLTPQKTNEPKRKFSKSPNHTEFML